MKIALISDCYVPRLGGIEMQVHDLARHLQNAGHEVVVITTTAGPTVVDGVRVHRIDAPLLPFDIPFTPKAFRSVGDVLAPKKLMLRIFMAASLVHWRMSVLIRHRKWECRLSSHCIACGVMRRPFFRF